MANALPLLIGGAAAAYFLTRKKSKPDDGATTAGPNGNGKTNGGEPAIGDTVGASTTPTNGVMWKVVKSPGGYTVKWMHIKEQVWHTVEGEFKTPDKAKMAIIDMISLGQIP